MDSVRLMYAHAVAFCVIVGVSACAPSPLVVFECAIETDACSPVVTLEAASDADAGIRVWGKLEESGRRRPIRRGEVTVLETHRMAIVDEKGRFRFDSLTADQTLRFTAEGHRTMVRSVQWLYAEATGDAPTTITIAPDLTEADVVRADCKSLADVSPDDTPETLFPAARGCFDAREVERALSLDQVALILSEFDTRRTIDKSAHTTPLYLREQAYFGLTQHAILEQLESEASGTLPTLAVSLCAFLSAMGPPSYAPHYMTKHGIRAFQTEGRDGLIPGFDSDAQWEGLLGEVGCV